MDSFVPTSFQQDPQVALSYLDPLLWIDNVAMTPEPWLARSWSFSDDGLTFTLTLRDDVRWHDDSPFTAADVVFALTCYRDDYDSAVSFMLAVVATIEAADPHTVILTLDEPDGTLPYNACNLPIFSRAQFEAAWTAKPVGERSLSGFTPADKLPTGTGPWKLEEWSSEEFRFTANRNHFAAQPIADTLILTVEDDRDARVRSWRADKLTVALARGRHTNTRPIGQRRHADGG